MYWHGTEGPYNVLVIDKLGKSLDRLNRMHKEKVPIAVWVSFAEQMVYFNLFRFHVLRFFIIKVLFIAM